MIRVRLYYYSRPEAIRLLLMLELPTLWDRLQSILVLPYIVDLPSPFPIHVEHGRVVLPRSGVTAWTLVCHVHHGGLLFLCTAAVNSSRYCKLFLWP